MSDKKELNPSPKLPNGEYPNLSPNPNTHNGLVDNTAEKANTQVVNPGQVQDKKDLTVSEIIALIQKYAPGFDPSDVEAGTLISALGLNADGALKKQALAGMFDGKYVRIMDAPTSDTLTDETINILRQGVFINGSFLGATNPIIMPFTGNRGIYFAGGNIQGFIISNHVISAVNQYLTFNAGDGIVTLKSNGTLNLEAYNKISIKSTTNRLKLLEKDFPIYPANTDIGLLICRKGTLEWYNPVAVTGITSGDTIALTSDLGKALLDHLEVEINGFRARYEYTDGNYVVYSSKTEADSGTKLQVNMISYNTTNGELSFNQMTFTPDN